MNREIKMCEQLFTLCNLQLGAIVEDLDKSVETVSNAAIKLMQNTSAVAAYPQTPAGVEASQPTDETLTDLKRIIVGLQFHDELAQRLNHIQVLLKLIQDQTTAVANPDFDAGKMLTAVSGIFSSSAEFKQLGKVFPEYKAANDTDVIELF